MNESSARYDCDSNEDADYKPIESEDSNDELEFNNSDASVSEDREKENEEEVLVYGGCQDLGVLHLYDS